ncbi:26969_t:CDS:2, partial [Gigaspora margarita]
NTATQNRYKNRGPKYPSVEKAINIWVSQVSAAGLVLTDELVKSKGREFGRLFGISEDELKFSNGWIANYKKRNSLHQYKLHGEAASVPLESLPNERIKLQNLLSQYELENVYNADETGLFYRMLPNQTLAKRPVAKSKQDKSQVTVLLAINATGSHKLQPLVIGHSKKPQSFSSIKLSQLLVTYKNNERAWIRLDIWEKWLRYIDSGFCIQNRKILLLVDNAPSHSSPEPPNNTNKIPSVSNIEDDDYQLSAENEDLINDSPGSRDTKRILEKQQKEQRGSTCERPRGSTHGSTRGRLHMDTVDQPESDILLENNEIEEIVAKLPDESSYVPETAQVITTYLQVIDEPVATEEILDDKGIVFMV